jgi:two-component system sensor histidine kinase DegS
VIQAQEEVRQRVAQRLHDGPAQSLANVVLTAEICEKLFQSDPKRAQSELGNLKGQVNSTLQDTRKFIFELRPMTLDDLGLVPTLRRYVADVGTRYQLQASLVAPQGEQRLPIEMEVPIFRVAQEAITNAVQHGHATQVRVTIALRPEGIVLTVEDNGSGFDVEQALAGAAARKTIGLANMQERAEMLGGWLRIESARGHGSRVELSAPMVRS